MTATLSRKALLVCSVAVFCAALIGCSSSDDGKVSELERQLDMEKAARMTVEQERDAAKTAQTTAEQERDAAKTAQTTAEQERDAAKTAQTTAEEAQAAAEAAQMTAEEAQAAAEAARMTAEEAQAAAKAAQAMAEQERDDAKATQMTAEQERDAAKEAQMAADQALADLHFDGAVGNAIEKVTAWGLRRGPHLRSDTAQLHRMEVEPRSGTEYASVSQTHSDGYRDHGERLRAALPWHGDDGQVEFMFDIMPESLDDDGLIWSWTNLWTSQRNEDINGSTTSYGPIEAHGLGSGWQGFEATKAYDSGGDLTVRFFTDLGESDNVAMPYTEEFDTPDVDIRLNDAHIPDVPDGREGLYVGIPNDEMGLKGTLDGVEGTFTCPEGYCSLLYAHDWLPGYFPWIDSAPVLFTPAGGGQPSTIRPAFLTTPSAEVPKANYLSLGSWLYVPEDTTDFDAFRFGLFAGGDDPFMGANLPGLAGTARYAGRATGMYVETVVPDVDTFSADVALTADFGLESESGMIAGSVSNFELGSGRSAPLSELLLEADDFDGDGPGVNIFPGWPGDHENSLPGGFVGGPANSPAGPEEGWWGEWGGRFFGNGNTATDHPTSFAGTFGATDGERSFAGSFGTHKQ